MLSLKPGFTLVELMLATVAMLMVGAALHRMLQTTLRLSRTQAEQLTLQTSARGAVFAVTNELRELSTRAGGPGTENDLLGIAPGEVTYRAMRGTGYICETAPPGQIRISRLRFSGHRMPQAGRDSVLVLHARSLESEPVWIPAPIIAVSTANPCPGPGNPGISLAVPVNDSITGAAAGTPVRLYEIMQLRLYQSGGKAWLGMRSVSAGEAIQPLFGPLSPDSGFRLEFLDSVGKPTLMAQSVRSVGVAVRPESESRPVREDANDRSSRLELQAHVVLRNALR